MTIAFVEMTAKISTPSPRKWPCQLNATELPLEVMNKYEAAHGVDASTMCLVAQSPYTDNFHEMALCDGCPFAGDQQTQGPENA